MNKAGFLLILALGGMLVQFSPAVAQVKPVAAPSAIQKKAIHLVAQLAKEDYVKASRDFDQVMKKVLPLKKLGEVWKSVIDKVGAFKKQAGTRMERAGKHDFVFVTCVFASGPLDIKVVFTGAGEITGFFFVESKPAVKYQTPEYVDRKAFRESDVKVGDAKWVLPATLALPRGKGPFPAVVLVHGSGPHDRDETIGPNKPFRDLAWGMASRGIAVLRYEKRTREHAAKLADIKNYPTIKEEVLDDALAAAVLLRKTPGIDAKKIFVLGHSLGGTLLPQIGAQDPALAGLIGLAGATRPLEDAILEQITYIYALEEKHSDDEKARHEKLKKQIALLKDPQLSPDTPGSKLPFGVPAVYWLSLRKYMPAQTAAKFKQPILILQGERDYQVTGKDVAGWKKLLAGRKNVRFQTYAKLNHLFIAGEGKIKPSEYEKAGHVDRKVIEDIAGWIKKQ